MAASRQALLGLRRPRNRTVSAVTAVLVGYALAFVARLGTVLPFIGLDIVAFAAGLGIAAYAGWARGGALVGLGSVFLPLLWISFIPPLVAYLRGLKFAGSRYSTIRMSQAEYTPEKEFEVAVGQVPFLLIVALLFGGVAFLLGAGARRAFGR